MAHDQFISFNFTFSPKFLLPPNFLPFAPSRPIFVKNFRSTTPLSKCVRPPQYELEDFCSVHACMVNGYQNSRQKNTIHNDSNFFPKCLCYENEL